MRTDSEAVPLDMSFIVCTEYLPYVSRFVAAIVCYADHPGKEIIMHSFTCVLLLRPSDLHHFLENVEHWMMEKVFECRLRINSSDPLFFNWRYTDFINTPPVRRPELFVRVPE